MRCGLVLSTMYPRDMPQRQAIEAWLTAAERAASHEFDVLFAGQHFLLDDMQMFQPIPVLARASAFSGRMRLGTGVLLLPLQNPVRIGEDMATLDTLTNGRTVMGVGLGYRKEEFEAFNTTHRDRVGRMTEGLELIRALWGPDPVSYRGKHFRMGPAGSNPKPVQPGGLPIWIAAHVDAAVKRAARISDAWLISPHSGLTVVERQVAIFREACAAVNREPNYHLERETHVAESDADAMQEAKPHLEQKYQSYLRWGQQDAMASDDRIDMHIDELVRDRFLIGSPDSIVRQVKMLHERLGITSIVFHVRWPAMDLQTTVRGIELLGREVLPRLANL